MNNIKYINIISQCPYCNSNLTIINNNGIKILKCENNKCNQKLINKLEHFCSKSHGLNMKGLSKATFEKLIDWEWINSLKDIFNLSQYKKQWINKPGFGIKSVEKILQSIEESKHTTLPAFISAIGIPLVGRTVAKDLSKYFKDYESFRAAVEDKNYHFFDLPNFGEEMDYQIKNFNYAEADEISKILIFEIPVVNNNNINNSLSNKTIVITGKLTKFKNRNELKEVIISHGGKVSDSISSNTFCLINNDLYSTSSKNLKAKKLNIPILSENEFIKNYIES